MMPKLRIEQCDSCGVFRPTKRETFSVTDSGLEPDSAELECGHTVEL